MQRIIMSKHLVKFVIAQAIEHNTSAILIASFNDISEAMSKFNLYLRDESKFFDKEFEQLIIVAMPSAMATDCYGFNYSNMEVLAKATNPRIRLQRKLAQTAFVVESIQVNTDQFGTAVNSYV